MDSITNDFWEVLLWTFWIFVWISAVMVWFRCVFDLFGDSELSGWAKAGWSILMIVLPWVGAIIYLIARGRSMADRQMASASRQQARQDDYIRKIANKSATPAAQIADAKALLDSGAIEQQEYESLKAKALT
jgi:hypothetical protein